MTAITSGIDARKHIIVSTGTYCAPLILQELHYFYIASHALPPLCLYLTGNCAATQEMFCSAMGLYQASGKAASGCFSKGKQAQAGRCEANRDVTLQRWAEPGANLQRGDVAVQRADEAKHDQRKLLDFCPLQRLTLHLPSCCQHLQEGKLVEKRCRKKQLLFTMFVTA